MDCISLGTRALKPAVSFQPGGWTLNLCSLSRKWFKKNSGRLLLFEGNRQGTGGWDLYASKLERRFCWKLRKDKNDKMLVRRAVTGSDLGILCFQSMKTLVVVFILIWSGTHFHLWALKVLLPLFMLLWYALLLPVVTARKQSPSENWSFSWMPGRKSEAGHCGIVL